MSEIKQTDIIDNLRGIDGNATLLDILLEFENMLDEQGMYAYENWKLGEVAQGPKLSRYWLNVTLLYPYLKMPNPKAALRLTNIGCDVKFKKATLKTPMTVKTQDDLDSNKKPKIKNMLSFHLGAKMFHQSKTNIQIICKNQQSFEECPHIIY